MSTEQPMSDHPEPNMSRNGIATAGFVLAVLAVVLFWALGVNLILWVLGLVFSAIGYSRAKAPGSTGRGLAIAGLAITLGGLVLIILFIAGAVAFGG